MLTDESVQLFKQSVDQAQSIFIFVSTQAKFDQVASALALFGGLQQLGKEVYLLSPVSFVNNGQKEAFTGLNGVEHFSQQIGNKNLQVSFDYQPDMVDKVSYNIDEEAKKFYLIIQPKKGTPPLDSKTVQFTQTGANVDLIITIGVTSLESLDGLYMGFESLFTEHTIISIHSFDTDYATVKINTSGTAAFSEAMMGLLTVLGVTFSPEMASNLLAGLAVASDDFRSVSATADTFEVVSQLLRAGGQRLPAAKIPKQGFSLATGAPAKLSIAPSGNLNSTNGFAQAIQQGRDDSNNKNRKQPLPVSEAQRMEGGSRG